MPRSLVTSAFALVLFVQGASGQQQAGTPSDRPVRKDTTTGFAIADQAVIANCSGCHVRDSTGRLERLSYLRKTPEGWETSIRRMVALNGVRIDAAVARQIVKYLSNAQGIAPEELKPARFEVERRSADWRYAADEKTARTCSACHSMGRVITQRRTRDEWELLVATHRGLYPDADFQAFRRFATPADSAGAPHPMDVAIAHLAKAYPLRTPEWNAWSATMRPPHLEGTWLLSGTQPGRGPFFGRVTIAPGASSDEFTTKATYRFARGGTGTREGKSMVYTGHQWRGRSGPAGTSADSLWREVMSVEPGWQEMSGRWYGGAYDEIGMDVTLTRLGAGTSVVGVWPHGLKTNARDQEVTIFGANLPSSVSATNVDFGPGVRVERVVRATSDEIVVRVAVDSAAQVGARDLFVAGAGLPKAAVVYDKISRIKVTPLAGMARVGGARFPKQLQQFDAVAYHDGADGKPDTDDDLEIGLVDATWSVEEYGTTYDDDDMKFVGAVDARGLFTPSLDGPNPQRTQSRNNVGDVWVVASYKPGGADPRTLKARAHLLVTVPLFVRFDPWRMAP